MTTITPGLRAQARIIGGKLYAARAFISAKPIIANWGLCATESDLFRAGTKIAMNNIG
jgi:hypothetical protein